MANAIIVNFLSYQRVRPLIVNHNSSVQEWLNVVRNLSTESIHKSYLHYKYELSRSIELNFLCNESRWTQAKRVLEIGFGPGFPIGNHRQFFNNKEYDLLALHLDTVDSKNRATTLTSQSPGAESGDYDAIYLREIITNTEGFSHLASLMFSHLDQKGQIISLEPISNQQQFYPQLPALSDLVNKRGSPHSHSDLCAQSQTLGISVSKTESREVHIMRQTEKLLVFHKYLLLPELILRRTGVESNQIAIYEELKNWLLQPHSTVQFTARFLIFSPQLPKGVTRENLSKH